MKTNGNEALIQTADDIEDEVQSETSSPRSWRESVMTLRRRQ